MTDVPMIPSAEHSPTIQRLEAIKHVTQKGVDYWFAREIAEVLGYADWRNFRNVIDRAAEACTGSGATVAHHFVETTKEVELGSGAVKNDVEDFYLSRLACYLIAMNGQPSKPEVAAAQAYFAVQARRMEQEDQRAKDEKRLEAREKAKVAVKRVSGIAKTAGVRNHMQAVFHDQRWQGLYERSAAEVKIAKGLAPDDNLFDRAGPLELSAHEFQMNLAAEAIAKEGIKSEAATIRRNLQVAKDVRGVMKKSGATMIEKIPLEHDTIKDVEKRLNPAAPKKVGIRKPKTTKP